MNSLRFQLIQVIDDCFGKLLRINGFSSGTHFCNCASPFRVVFKDRKTRPKIFAYFHLILTITETIFFSFRHSLGIRIPTEFSYQWIFFSIILLELLLAVGLIYSFYQRNTLLSIGWCILEIIIVNILLFLTLSEHVKIYWPGRVLIGCDIFSTFYGLWAIYYFTLEYNSDPFYFETDKRDSVVEYNAQNKPPPPKRRGTDVTSLGSSTPLSPRRVVEDIEARSDIGYDYNADSGTSSPVRTSFPYRDTNQESLMEPNEEPQYAEVIVGTHEVMSHLAQVPVPKEVPPDNLIISDLMCGGTSSINSRT